MYADNQIVSQRKQFSMYIVKANKQSLGPTKNNFVEFIGFKAAARDRLI